MSWINWMVSYNNNWCFNVALRRKFGLNSQPSLWSCLGSSTWRRANTCRSSSMSWRRKLKVWSWKRERPHLTSFTTRTPNRGPASTATLKRYLSTQLLADRAPAHGVTRYSVSGHTLHRLLCILYTKLFNKSLDAKQRRLITSTPGGESRFSGATRTYQKIIRASDLL